MATLSRSRKAIAQRNIRYGMKRACAHYVGSPFQRVGMNFIKKKETKRRKTVDG